MLGYDVADLVLNADPDELNDTRNAQPALCVLSVGIARALMARGVQPAAVLGFSLGQVSALAVSGMLSDEATFALVKARSELMAEALRRTRRHERAAEGRRGRRGCALRAVRRGRGAGARELQLPGADRHRRCARGRRARRGGMGRGGEALVAFGHLGRVHSPLMADAAAGLAAYLDNVEFSEARIPLVCNVTAAPLSAADARENLVRHLTSPVRFDASVAALTDRRGGHVRRSRLRRRSGEPRETHRQDRDARLRAGPRELRRLSGVASATDSE
ncbi:MAG: ACP S-malonyltransferase [Eggerthella lenta]